LLTSYRNQETPVVGKPTANENMNVAGLMGDSPTVMTPTLWNYTVCGQYPRGIEASFDIRKRADNKVRYS